jgi:tight adherence protein C
MQVAILVFSLVFLLIAVVGVLIFNQQAVRDRLTAVIWPQSKETKKATLLSNFQQSGVSIKGIVEQFERVLPRSHAEVSVVQQRLIRAGYRNASAVKRFYGTKVLVPLILCAVVLVTGLGQTSFFIYISALGLGFLAPDFWLGRQITKRQAKIRRGLPDVLDLLVICIEAGLSMDQAVIRTAQELAAAHPAICDELNIVILEQRAGRPRVDAWKNLSQRADVDTLRSLVSVLVQSEQFGTSIARTLRTQADTLRNQRIQKIEEMAAKTTVKLVFPLVLFIFPSLFVVVLGPAIIMMAESFKKLLN